MRILCPNCGAKLTIDGAQLTNGVPLDVKCWMCTWTHAPEMSRAGSGSSTIAMGSPWERSGGARIDGAVGKETTSLSLPEGKVIKISVIEGASQGVEHDLSRPLVTIGRLGGGADIEIDDPGVSRVHCAVEARRDAIFLHDLRSTNGTFLGNSRVLAAPLEESSKFRIGSSVLQVSFVPS